MNDPTCPPPNDALLSWQRRGGTVFVYVGGYNDGPPHAHLRVHYKETPDGPWIGTRKGVALKRAELDELAGAIDELRKRFDAALVLDGERKAAKKVEAARQRKERAEAKRRVVEVPS